MATAPRKGYLLSPNDLARTGRAVRDFESRTLNRPVAVGQHVKTTARAVVFELISETPDADGLYDVYIMQRKPDGTGYQAISTVKAKLEDINA